MIMQTVLEKKSGGFDHNTWIFCLLSMSGEDYGYEQFRNG